MFGWLILAALSLALPPALPLAPIGAPPARAEDRAGNRGPEPRLLAAMPAARPGESTLTLFLPGDPHRAPFPLVVAVSDSLGPDGRADRITALLLARGVAVLDLDPFIVTDGPGQARRRDRVPEAVSQAADLAAQHPAIDPDRVALLGFGAGGRAAWLARPGSDTIPRFVARAILYPGCQDLVAQGQAGAPADASAGLLLMHGSLDTENGTEACARLVQGLPDRGRLRHVSLRGAGYAWDRPAPLGEGGTLLPAPGGEGRVPAAPWTYMAQCSARMVAAWLSDALGARGAVAAAACP